MKSIISYHSYHKLTAGLTNKTMKDIAKVLGLALLFSFILGSLHIYKAYAYAPQYVPYDIRETLASYDDPNNINSECKQGKYYDNVPWIAPSSNSALSPSMTVPYGTTSVAMTLTWLVMLCHVIVDTQPIYPYPNNDLTVNYDNKPSSSAALTQQIAYIQNIFVSSGPGSISGFSPTTITDPYNGGTRFWFGNGVGFTYNAPPGGFKQTTTVTISAYDYVVNDFHGTNPGTWICVSNPPKFTSNSPPTYNCPRNEMSFSFTFVVPQVATIGHIDESGCVNPSVAGWAFDPNNSSASIYVSVYDNGNYLNSYLTTGYRPDVNAAYNITGYHGFNIDLTAYNGASANTFTLYAISTSGNPALNTNLGSVTIGPCIGYSCGSVNPPAVGESDNFNLVTSVNYSIGSSGSPPSGSGQYSISVSSGIYSNNSIGFSVGPGQITNNPVNLTINNPGIYTVSWSFSENGITINCSGGLSIFAQPFTKVYNGDVATGSSFNSGTNQCTFSNASIYGWNSGQNQFKGSGTNLGIIATGNIFGFTSNDGSGGLPPSGLSFANDYYGTQNGQSWGGNIASLPCINDYYGTLPPGTYQPTTTSNDIIINSGYCGAGSTSSCVVYYTNTPQVNSSGINLQAGEHAIVYVKGNVNIEGNITYGNWGSVFGLNGIPSFTLIASGNIYISPNVSQLNGMFVAQGGSIYTCMTSGVVPSPYYSSCSQKLTIYGSLVSSNIEFMRTSGTQARALTPSSNLCQNADPNAAEVICYTPALWLGTPYSNNDSFNAIGSLPPIL